MHGGGSGWQELHIVSYLSNEKVHGKATQLAASFACVHRFPYSRVFALV
jgi:hypothetical protein